MKYLFLVIALFIGPVCMAHSDENFIESDLFGNLGERDRSPGSLDLPDYPEEIEGKGSRTPESGPGTHSAA